MFLTLHFWPKNLEMEINEKNSIKDYNVVVRWVFWTIMFVTFAACLLYKINEYFFTTLIAQKLPPAKSLNLKKNY